MKFGFTLKPDHSIERTLDLTRRAEAAGFDYGWLFDSHVLWREPYPLLTLMATATERLRLGTCVETAHFDEDTATWTLETAPGERFEHRVLVSATGGLTEARLPRIEGLDRFRGPLWHSAAWRDDVDLTGLRVAVVGSAASAVQVVPDPE